MHKVPIFTFLKCEISLPLVTQALAGEERRRKEEKRNTSLQTVSPKPGSYELLKAKEFRKSEGCEPEGSMGNEKSSVDAKIEATIFLWKGTNYERNDPVS